VRPAFGIRASVLRCGTLGTAKASNNMKNITAASSATCWLESAITCVMVPKKTENWLRFSARMHDGASEVRFERAVWGYSVSHEIARLFRVPHRVITATASTVRKLSARSA
jgi:hypothetical protein